MHVEEEVVNYKHILSLDAGYYKGYLTARFVSYMETKAYFLALEHCNIADRANEKIAMTELYDMIAGSESGGIIAAMLTIPNDNATLSRENKYFASDATRFFEEQVDELYKDIELSLFWSTFIICTVVVICGGVTFWCVGKAFYIEGYDDNVKGIAKILKERNSYFLAKFKWE